MSETIRILIVEDEPLVAEDIGEHLESLGFKVAEICYSGEDAIAFLNGNEVDAAILDISLEGKLDGVAVAEYINAHLEIPFVYLSSHADRETIERVKVTRPSAYLVKPFNERDLLTSVELAIANYGFRRSAEKPMTIGLINAVIVDSLSDREYDILCALQSGKTNTEIADTLFLSINTIKSHLQHIYSKLGVKNRTAALFKIEEIRKRS